MTLVEALYASFYQQNFEEGNYQDYTFADLYQKAEAVLSGIPLAVFVFVIAFELLLLTPKIQVFADTSSEVATRYTTNKKITVTAAPSPTPTNIPATPTPTAIPTVTPMPTATIQPTKPPAHEVAQDTGTLAFENVYKAAGEKYGIPWQILYGLHYTETGCRTGDIYNVQGSGAQGPMQFMPRTWSVYGVDGDGDGEADIDNVTDAIYGAANYLSRHGDLDHALHAYGTNVAKVYRIAATQGY